MSTRTYTTAATRGSTTSCPRVSAGRKSQRAAAASRSRSARRRRRGCDADTSRRIAAPPRLDMSPANRGSAAVGNVSGESRRRRGRDAYTSPANRGAAAAATRIRLRRIAASPRLDTSSVAALRPCARWRGLPAAHEAAKFLGPRDQRRRGFRTQALRCSGTPSRLNQSGRNIRTSSLEESRFFFVLSQEQN